VTLHPTLRGIVLVVDPDDDTRELYAEWLALEGHGVLEARDAETALVLAAKHHPAVIVTEIRLQPFDGFELLSRLKSTPVVEGIPVVVATSQADARTLTRARAAGAAAALAKPSDFYRVCTLVGALMTAPPRPRRLGRPAAGLRGALTSNYPQLTVRLPPDARASLAALATVEKRPMWRVLMAALASYERQYAAAAGPTVEELRAALAAIRARVQQAGRDDHQRLLHVLLHESQTAAACVLAADDQARLVAASDAALALIGYPRAELLASTVWDLTPPDDLANGRATWQRFLEAGEFDGFYRLKRKDGSLVWVRAVAAAHVVSGLHLSALAEVSDSTIVAA